jgi:hypothetical protein
MKLRNLLPILAIAWLMLPALAVAQDKDTDKQKLIEIEKAFAAQPNAGPEAAALVKKHLYNGTVNQVTPMGRIGAMPRARIVEMSSKPDPNDPNVKSSQSVSDFHVDIYGDTALVAYKETNTDTGHKDPALNVTDHWGCLDTFVKRKGGWYIVGNACSPDQPLPQSEWNAAKKAMANAPKDVQEAYH